MVQLIKLNHSFTNSLHLQLLNEITFILIDCFWNSTAVQTTLPHLPSKTSNANPNESVCLSYDTPSLIYLFASLALVKLTIAALLASLAGGYVLLQFVHIVFYSCGTGLVFSRRFSSEKCPTLTVASFFFVRPQTSSRMYHFLQKLIKLLRPSPANANLVQRVPLPFLTFIT